MKKWVCYGCFFFIKQDVMYYVFIPSHFCSLVLILVYYSQLPSFVGILLKITTRFQDEFFCLITKKMITIAYFFPQWFKKYWFKNIAFRPLFPLYSSFLFYSILFYSKKKEKVPFKRYYFFFPHFISLQKKKMFVFVFYYLRQPIRFISFSSHANTLLRGRLKLT